MQNKGFVRVFAVLLTLVCLFYLSFSFVTERQIKKAETYAAGDQAKLNWYLDSLSSEKVWLGYTFRQCREMEIGLGLDLKGGMNVILEISVADVLKSLSDNNTDPNFNKALALASSKQATASKDFISLFVEEYKALDPNMRLSAIFSTFKLKEKITPSSTNAQVEEVLRQETEDAISNSFNVLRTRIDRFGVVAPNIQRMETAGRILVELPGIKEPERVRKLLQGSANLEFWETYELSEIYPQLANANTVITETLASEAPVSEEQEIISEEVAATQEPASTTDSLAAEIDIMQQAQSETANAEDFEKKFPLFSKLMVNQSQGQIGPGPLVGYALSRDTAEVNRYLSMKSVKDLLPRNVVFKWSNKAIDDKGQLFSLIALKVTTRNGRAPLEGDVITDARDDFGQTSKSPEVTMSMNAEGAKVWARLTRDNIGRSIAVVLDGYVYSFPTVNTEIPNGSSVISGNFTPEEAKDLANVLKSGKMAASVRIVQEDIVGPSLGQEAIQAGIWSFVIALVLLMAYMISIYGFIPGLIANVGLLINFFFTLGILASFQAVLTLSGIAGLVLSLGVAVDANVLIYERAKEELASGKNLKKAVNDAFSNAFSAIFDSNLTSVITGIILFMFGTGPIRGFATTLIIGLVSSFFTTVFLSRLFFETALNQGWIKNLTFTTAMSKNILRNVNINFIKQRKTGYIISAVMLLLCIGSFFIRGLNQGIDFTGGRNYIVRFDNPVSTQKIDQMLRAEFGDASISVITIGDNNQVRISTNYGINDETEGIDQQIEGKIFKAVQSLLPAGVDQITFSQDHVMSFQKVGPSMADDIKTGAFWALVLSFIAMGLYILIRFRDIAFSVGTVASVVHDTLIIIGVYSLLYGIMPFSMEVDQTFIAAILTVIGYSVNDTVVIFDRIREVKGLYPKRPAKEVINEALNTTLARTFSTSLSTAIVLLCIFILGGDTIRSFTFAMLFGVVIGTYSTLYVAVPLAYEMISRKEKKALEAVHK